MSCTLFCQRVTLSQRNTDTFKPHQAEPGQIGAPCLAPGRGPWPPKYLGKRRIRSGWFVYVIMHYCWTGRVLQEQKMSPNIEIIKTHPHHHHDQYPYGSNVKTDHKFATFLSVLSLCTNWLRIRHISAAKGLHTLGYSRAVEYNLLHWGLSDLDQVSDYGNSSPDLGKTSPVRPIPTPRAECCDRQSPVTLAETSGLGNFICCCLLVNKWLCNLANWDVKD